MPTKKKIRELEDRMNEMPRLVVLYGFLSEGIPMCFKFSLVIIKSLLKAFKYIAICSYYIIIRDNKKALKEITRYAETV
jgi:hypothetical protein